MYTHSIMKGLKIVCDIDGRDIPQASEYAEVLDPPDGTDAHERTRSRHANHNF